MVTTPRNCVREFSYAMEDVLSANDWKGGWHNCSNRYLLRRLEEEVAELKNAMRRRLVSTPQEATDVANIAMMIWHNYYARQAMQRKR